MMFTKKNFLRLKEAHNYPPSPTHSFIDLAQDDFLKITKDKTSIDSCTFTDFSNLKKAHLDAIQLIPKNVIHPRSQFIGTKISDIQIQSNSFIAPSAKLQCIFASDGLLENIQVRQNVLLTDSRHEISLSGLLSGHISQNYSLTGRLANVLLKPLRIGGGLLGYETHIISFSNPQLTYQPIDEIVFDHSPDGTRVFNHVEDLRSRKFNSHDVFLSDFDLDGFIIEASKIKEPKVRPFIEQVTTLAFSFGHLVE